MESVSTVEPRKLGRHGLSTPASTPLKLLFLAAIALVSIVLGVAASILPYQLVLTFVALPVGILVAVLYPWIGLLVLIGLTTGVVPTQYIPRLPLAGGEVKVNDLVLGLVFIALFARHRTASIAGLSELRRFRLGLACMAACVVLGTGVAFAGHVPIKYMLADLRTFAYWMVAPMVLMAFRDSNIRRRFIFALLMIAGVLSVFQILQGFFDVQILSSGRLEAAGGFGPSLDTYRTTTLGIFLIIFGIFYLIGQYFFGGRLTVWSLAVLWLYFGGLLVTYGRTLWIATGIGILALIVLARGHKLGRFLFVSTFAAVVAVSALAIGKPEVIHAATDRLLSVKKEIVGGKSLAWRYEENRLALSALAQRPFTGIGLGAEYKPFGNKEIFEGERRYIHNSYLALLLKLGPLGLAVFLVTYMRMATFGIRRARTLGDPREKGAAASATLVFLLPIATALTRPEWVTYETITCLATMMGIFLASARVWPSADRAI